MEFPIILKKRASRKRTVVTKTARNIIMVMAMAKTEIWTKIIKAPTVFPEMNRNLRQAVITHRVIIRRAISKIVQTILIARKMGMEKTRSQMRVRRT